MCSGELGRMVEVEMQRSLGRYGDYSGDTHTWDWVQVDSLDLVDTIDMVDIVDT